MSKKRPGHEAALRLSRESDASVWARVESRLPEVLRSIPDLERLDSSRWHVAKTVGASGSMCKDQLLTIVQWKFKVGKARNALLKYLRQLSEEEVRDATSMAISKAKCMGSKDSPDDGDRIKDAMLDLMTLKGVGPATASAILSLTRPDVFSYMFDEAIDCFSRRNYTLKEYVDLNDECTVIAKNLGGSWTPFRVSQCLWIAAKSLAMGGVDHTAYDTGPREHKNAFEGRNGTDATRPEKRRKRSR